MAQTYTSKATSINRSKLPAVYNKAIFSAPFVFDYGCGKYTDHIRQHLNGQGRELFPYLLKIRFAIAKATDGGEAPFSKEETERIGEIFRIITKRGDCLSLKELAVTGGDLIERGMKPGKEVGEILQRLLEIVLEHPEQNTKEFLFTQI